MIQDLDEDQIKWTGKSQEGSYVLKRLYHAILKVHVPVVDAIITIFNCHLNSKLGEYNVHDREEFSAEAVLTEYDLVGRAMGAMRASMRHMAEACVLRRLIIEELHDEIVLWLWVILITANTQSAAVKPLITNWRQITARS